MKRSLFLFLCLCFSLFAEEEDEWQILDALDYDLSTVEVHNKAPNSFQPTTDLRLPIKVNPISGTYTEQAVDLIVAGAEPLSLRRFYSGAFWYSNPETHLQANFEWKEKDLYANIGDESGFFSKLKRRPKDKTHLEFKVSEGFMTFQSDGQSHPLNIKFHWWKVPDPERDEYYQYVGTVVDGSGRQRFFATEAHCWTKSLVLVKRKRKLGIKVKEREVITPNSWTPYNLPILEERLPNGNWICYSYQPWIQKLHSKGVPRPQLLRSITAYNQSKTKVLATLEISYQMSEEGEILSEEILGSDGRRAVRQYPEKGGKLVSAQAPGQPLITYTYDKQKLKEVGQAGGKILKLHYYPFGHVAKQFSPVGPDGEMEFVAHYQYMIGYTRVVDGKGNAIEYHYDTETKQLRKIKYCRGKSVYRTISFTRNGRTGNILSKSVEDREGTILQMTYYQYDKNQNPVEEKVGIGNEWRVVTRTYSEDGFNLKLSESDREGKVIRYSYLPGTNLLISELTYEGDEIRKRIFHSYDDCAICIETIIDDGCTEDKHNLKGVKYRRITRVTPKQTLPCFGLPEIIEEKSIDRLGREVLLSKVIYRYAPSGKILEEDHYDADGIYRYSIYNEYDQEERLIATWDAMGNRTTYGYDAHHNQISVSGPRQDQHQEISYDAANRPIRVADWQSDGSIVTREKKYNCLGQVSEEIDPCQKSTRFCYDVSGQISSVTYPDQAAEKRKFDPFDNVIEELDAEGYVIKKSYNAFRQPISICYPDGSLEKFEYNTTGTVSLYQDKKGTITHYTYDIFDHLIQTDVYCSFGTLLKSTVSCWTAFQKLSEQEKDLVTTYHYDYAGRLISEERDTQELVYGYDSLGRVASTQKGEVVEKQNYDLLGHVVWSGTFYSEKLQKEEYYVYDAMGNCIETRNSQGKTTTSFNTDGQPLSIMDAVGNSTLFAYSYEGNFVKSVTNPKGIETVVSHDSRGRESMRYKKNRKGAVIQKSESRYNLNGKLVELTHTVFAGTREIKRITHHWEYGPLGRLERFIEAGEKESRYLYDDRGKLTTLIKPDGKQHMYRYDELGRLHHHFGLDFDYLYFYDARDRLYHIVDKNSRKSILRRYDALSHLLEETQDRSRMFSYEYDAMGRKKSCRLLDDSAIFYEYEGIYPSQVIRNGYTFSYNYNLEGQLVRLTTPVGKIFMTRDRVGRYRSVESPFFSAHYHQYDGLGQLLHYSFTDQEGTCMERYQYDDLDQLVQEEGHSYEYDSLNNRLKRDGENYQINALCQVTKEDKYEYRYDDCGNLIWDGVRKYSYDTLDRLIRVEEGERKTEYSYDPLHRRIGKSSYVKGRKIESLSYLWEGDHEIGLLDEKGQLIELRILGEGVGADIGAAIMYELGDKKYVPIHDHRGCVVTLVDLEKKKSLENYRYSAFGEELTGDRISPWGFSSKRVDEETGFVYFGRRYYDPRLGRWISKDPWGFEDGPNPYAYVHNGPLTQVDLHGLMTVLDGLQFVQRSPFYAIEFWGANVMPYPGYRTVVESIGRWGAGGGLFSPSRYRTGRNQIIHIEGRQVPGQSYTHANGMLTRIAEARKQAEYISETHGGLAVDLLYNGTEGLLYDAIGCAAAKLNLRNSYNKMCVNYYREKLSTDASHQFTSSVHSRGGIQMMNTGKILQDHERKRIMVYTYGSATLIPKKFFADAENVICQSDIIPMTNPIAYFSALLGNKDYNIRVLQPKSYGPLKAHGLLEATYAQEISDKGKLFSEKYFSN